MRNGAAVFAALMCVVTLSEAQRLVAPYVTGEMLVRKLTPVEPADMTSHSEGDLLSRQEMARFRTTVNYHFYEGYFSAVHDTAVNKQFCYDPKYPMPKPDIVESAARQGLFSLSAEQLKRDASELLIEIWREKWPCPERRGK